MLNEEQEQASRDWYTRAIVRVKETAKTHSVWPYRERTFHAGEELAMVQWGRAGRPVMRDTWWTSFDIDSSLIISSDKVEVIRIVEDVPPGSL